MVAFFWIVFAVSHSTKFVCVFKGFCEVLVIFWLFWATLKVLQMELIFLGPFFRKSNFTPQQFFLSNGTFLGFGCPIRVTKTLQNPIKPRKAIWVHMGPLRSFSAVALRSSLSF